MEIYRNRLQRDRNKVKSEDETLVNTCESLKIGIVGFGLSSRKEQ